MRGIARQLSFFEKPYFSLFAAIQRYLPPKILLQDKRLANKKCNQCAINVLFENTDSESFCYQKKLLQIWSKKMPPSWYFSAGFKHRLFQIIQTTSIDPQYRYYGLFVLARLYNLPDIIEVDPIEWDPIYDVNTFSLYTDMISLSKKTIMIHADITLLMQGDLLLTPQKITALYRLNACATHCNEVQAEFILGFSCHQYKAIINLDPGSLFEASIHVFSPIVSPNYIQQVLDELISNLFLDQESVCELTQGLIVQLYKASHYLRKNKGDSLLKLVESYLLNAQEIQQIQFFSLISSVLGYKNEQEIVLFATEIARPLSIKKRFVLRSLFIEFDVAMTARLIRLSIDELETEKVINQDVGVNYLIMIGLLADYLDESHCIVLKKLLPVPFDTNNLSTIIVFERRSLLESVNTIQHHENCNQLSAGDFKFLPHPLEKQDILNQIFDLAQGENCAFPAILEEIGAFKPHWDVEIAEKLTAALIQYLDHPDKEIASQAMQLIFECLSLAQPNTDLLMRMKSLPATVVQQIVALYQNVLHKINEESFNLKSKHHELTINYT